MEGFLVYRVVGRNIVGEKKGRMEAFQLLEPKIQPDWCEDTWKKMIAEFYKRCPDAAIFSCEKVVSNDDKVELQRVWYNKALVHIMPMDVIDRLPINVSFSDIVVGYPPDFFKVDVLGNALDLTEPPLTLKQKSILFDFKKHNSRNNKKNV